MRYFKKSEPQTKVILGNNQPIQFSTVDGLVGWFATDEQQHGPYVAQEFERLMKEGRYALSEVSADEFMREYVEKKSPQHETQSFKNSREEWGATGGVKVSSPIARLGAERVQELVGAAGPVKPTPVATAVEDPNKPKSKPDELKATLGRRSPPKKST